MLSFMYTLIKDFGGFGVGLASIALNGFLFWKLFTNHLKHLTGDIQAVGTKVSIVDAKVDGLAKDQTSIKERVSNLEGRLA